MSAKNTARCIVCKTALSARLGAKTCSPTCRKRLQRQTRAQVASKAQRLETAVGKEFHRLAADLLRKHVLYAPLVLGDERGAVMVPGLATIPDQASESSDLEPIPHQATDQPAGTTSGLRANLSLFRFNRAALLLTSCALVLIALIGGASYWLIAKQSNKQSSQNTNQPAASFVTTKLSLDNLGASPVLPVGQANSVTINGQLKVTKSLVLLPSSAPAGATAGQIYYDQSTNAPYYYNGSQFVSLAPTATSQNVTSLGGSSGIIALGSGLQISGNQLAISSALQHQLTKSAGALTVSALDTLSGALILNNSSGVGSTITVDDASTTAKGIAQFNSSNFTATAGVINTIQGIGTAAAVQFGSLQLGGDLTLAAGATIHADNIVNSGVGNNIVLNAGNNNIEFENQGGANTFTFPTSGGVGQTICTTGVTCASGGGVAVLLEPNIAQTASSNLTSIFINKTGGSGNIIELQNSGNDAFVVANTGAASFGNSLTVQGANLTIGNPGTTAGNLSLANATSGREVVLQGLNPTGVGNATLQIPSFAGGTTDTVCLLTLANCVGVGGSVSTTGGTQNYITKYNNAGASQITSSELFDNGSGVSIGNTTPAGLFNVGTTNQFQVSNNGAVTAVGVNGGVGLIQGTGGLNITGNSTIAGTLGSLTGLTSSGIITFSSLNTAGVLHTNGSGVLSTSAVILGTDTSGNYVATLGSLTGLTTSGNSGAGSTPTLSVTYGSGANTAAQGNTTLVCPSGTGNLTGAGNTITLGSGGTCNSLTVVNSPTFSGTLTVQGTTTTIGTSSQPGSLVLNDGNGGSNKTATLQAFATLGQNTVYTLPDPGVASVNLCLSTGNCAGAGGGITGSGTAGDIALFNGTGSITDSGNLSESGSAVTDSGTLAVNTLGSSGSTVLCYNGSNQLSSCSSSAGSGSYILNGTSIQTNANFAIQSASSSSVGGVIEAALGQTADLLDLRDSSGTPVAEFTSTGNLLLPNGSPSTPSLEVGANNQGLSASGGDVSISTTGGARLTIKANGNIQTLGNPVVAAGTNVVPLTLQGFSSGQTADLFDVQTSTPTNVFKIGATGAVTTKNSVDSTAAFQIQNAAGTSNLLIADTTNNRIGLDATPANGLLTIGTNTTGSSNGLYFGTDTNLYRNGAGVLQTDSEIATLGSAGTSAHFAAGPLGSVGQADVVSSAAGVLQVNSFVGVGSLLMGAAGSAAVVVQGQSSQTGDLLQFQNNSSQVLSGFNSNGNLYLGRASGATGTIQLFNSNGSGSITLTPANPSSSSYTLTVPAETGTLCSTAGSVGCLTVYAPTTGGTGYIQNQNASPQTANYSITGDGTIGGSLILTGSGTLPGSPTAGQIYYDTALKQLLIYENGQWQGYTSTATEIVAASNSNNKYAANFVATGTNDQNTINSAISALPSTGGSVVLLDGTYNVGGDITISQSNVSLIGQGNSTILKRMYDESGANTGGVITITASSIPAINILISQLQINGNKVTYTSTNDYGIFINSAGCNSGNNANNEKLNNNWITNTAGYGIYLDNYNCAAQTNNAITNNVISNAGTTGIYTDGGNYTTVSGNTVTSSGATGISFGTVSQGLYDLISNNTVSGNGGVGMFVGSGYTTVSGNSVDSNTTIGIQLNGFMNNISATNNTVNFNGTSGIQINTGSVGYSVTGNSISSNTGAGIVSNGNDSLISGNSITSNGTNGIMLGNGSVNETVSNNYVYNNGGSGSSSGIYLVSGNISNDSIVGNTIIHTNGTGFAIAITPGCCGQYIRNTYLSGNTYSGAGASSISDTGAGTIYANQLDSSSNVIVSGQAGVGLNVTSPSDSVQAAGAFVQGGISTPAAPTVAAQGTTGATTWGYKVTAYDGQGETLASTETQISNGNATLTGSNYNLITPVRVYGAVSYKVYRTTAGGTPNTTGLIGTIAAGAATFSLSDTGLSASTAAPTTNTTGQDQFLGYSALFKNSTNNATAFQIQNSSGNNVLAVDTSGNQIVLGTAGTIQGGIVFNDAAGGGTHTVTLQGPGSDPAANYTLQLPTAAPGTSQCLQSGAVTASQLTFSSCGAAGINSIGSFDSQTPSSNGAVISGSSLYFQSASTANPGMVNNGSQTFGGAKTFQTNSTTGFQIQNTSGNNLLQADTTTNNIIIGGNDGLLGSSWSAAQVLPTNRFGTTVVTANGYAYVIGGYNGTAPQSTVYYSRLYSNGGASGWISSGNTLPQGLYDATSVVANGYVYVLGGANPSAVSTVYYAKLNSDGSIGSWTTANNALPANRYSATSVAANGYIYEIGGDDGTNVQTTVYYAKLNSDGSIGSWTTASNPLPNKRFFHTSVTANGYVYVIGGGDGTGVAYSTVYYAALNSNGSVGTWNTATSLSTATYGASSVIANSGYLYVMGGWNGTSGYMSTVSYAKMNNDGTIGGWSTTTSLPAASYNASAIVSDGYVYVIDGYNGSGPTATVYYSSGQRVQVSGSLDLVGVSGQSLADPGTGGGVGSTGGALTAGDGTFVGNLQVQGQAIFSQSLAINNTLNVGGSQTIQTQTNSTTAFQIQNSSGNNILNVDTSGNILSIGKAGTITSNITLYNGSGSGSISLQAANPASSSYTITIPAETGTLCTTASTGICNTAGGLTNVAYLNGTGPQTFTGNNKFTGTFLSESASNSTTAFQIQNTSGNNLLQADTTNNNIIIGGNDGQLQPWTSSSTNMPAGGLDFFSSVTANGYVYVIGGYNGTPQTAVYYGRLYASGGIGTWLSATALPQATNNASAVVANGYLYLIGGGGGSLYSTVYYAKINSDGSLGSWITSSNPLPNPRSATTAVVAGGYVYVMGGYNGSSVQSTVYYAKLNSDGSTGSWTTSSNPLPLNREDATSVVANNYIYVIGGTDGTGQQSTVYYAWHYADGSVGTWSSASALPAAVYGASSVIANSGYLYVMGGWTGSYSTNIYYAKLNDDGTVTWNGTPLAMPTGLYAAASVMSDGYVYILGGTNGSLQPNIYYASGQRVQISGSLDLVGVVGDKLVDAGTPGGVGSTGTALTAGDGTFVGNLQVIGQSTFAQGVAVNNTLNVGGTETIQTQTNTTTAFQIQNTSAVSLFTADTSNLIITVAGTTSTFASLTLTNAHFKSTQTTAPTIGTPTNCGTGTGPSASVAANSTDSAGSFGITAGTTGSPTTCDTVFTFNKTYGAAPKSVVVVAETQDGGTGTAAARQVYVSATSATTFTVKFNSSPATSEVNWFYYWVVE